MIRWNGHVARKGERRDASFRWGKLKDRDQMEDTSVDWRVILRWIFRKWE